LQNRFVRSSCSDQNAIKKTIAGNLVSWRLIA